MYKYIKHFLDVIIAIVLLFLFSPIFIVIAILIKLESRGPIIFKQERLGYKGKVFKIYKFRSMVVHAEDNLESLMQQNEMDGPVFF